MDRNGPEANSGRPPATDVFQKAPRQWPVAVTESEKVARAVAGPPSTVTGQSLSLCGLFSLCVRRCLFLLCVRGAVQSSFPLALPARKTCLPVPRGHRRWKLGKPHFARCCRDSMKHDWPLPAWWTLQGITGCEQQQRYGRSAAAIRTDPPMERARFQASKWRDKISFPFSFFSSSSQPRPHIHKNTVGLHLIASARPTIRIVKVKKNSSKLPLFKTIITRAPFARRP